MREEKKGFPYDPAPDVNRFPGVPESGFDLVNEYGTYNIQPTADTDNLFPLIAPGAAAPLAGDEAGKGRSGTAAVTRPGAAADAPPPRGTFLS